MPNEPHEGSPWRDQIADKTVIITGASQGIGAGLVNGFLGRGYNVVATSRRVSQSAEIGASDRLALVDGDIADPETAKAAVGTALARFGSIAALVNNAGIFFTKPFIDYTIEDYRRLAATNLEGFLHITQRVVRHDAGAEERRQHRQHYHADGGSPDRRRERLGAMLTKGGVEAMSKNIAMEYAKEQIRANTVAPGVVDTPLHQDNPKEFLKTLSPRQGVSTVQEIVDAVLFLTEAPRITGETLHVDGGAHLGRW